MDNNLIDGAHCRICGSLKLNRSHFNHDITDKIGFYRILTGDSSVDRLIRPCDCRGDFAFAHQVCLSEWIEATEHKFCDVCRFRYNIRIYERSIFDWMSETQQVERIFKMILMSTLVYYISSLGVLQYQSRRASNPLVFMVFASACIWSVACTIAIAIYSYWLLREFLVWKVSNRRIEVDENKHPQLDGQPAPRDVLKSSGFKPK